MISGDATKLKVVGGTVAKTKKKTTTKRKAATKKNGASKSWPTGYGAMPVNELIYADWNYKTDDDEILAKLTKNIKKNGLIENLIVRELDDGRYEVVNGNHRLKVMHILKRKEAMCFNLGKLSRAEAQRIALETNETRFATDDTRLASLIKEMSGDIDISDLLTTVTFKQDEIDDLLKLADFDWDSLDKDDTGYSNSGTDDDGLKIIELKLPDEVATEFQLQINRVKKALQPKESNLDKISNAVPIEILTRHISKVADNKLIPR